MPKTFPIPKPSPVESSEPELSSSALRKERKKRSKERREKESIAMVQVPLVVAGHSLLGVFSFGKDPLPEPTQGPDGLDWSISIALPGSILDNAQTPLLKSYLAGQIARAAAIYGVSEIVIFDDTDGVSTSACTLMAMLLQYLECPQYLKKKMFAVEPVLGMVGALPPVDMPHHLTRDQILPYREGVVRDLPFNNGSLVDCGLSHDVRVQAMVAAGTRVTVSLELDPDSDVVKPKLRKKKYHGVLAPPDSPRITHGLYWGYNVRIAQSLSQVFTQYGQASYDLTIGTSDRGTPVPQIPLKKSQKVLIVFGGVEGLEYAMSQDDAYDHRNPALVFDHYFNTCPKQGTRTIRTEEAILISLATLKPLIVH